MLMLRSEMADAYAWKNTMLQAAPPPAPPPAPQPGDLHLWDALVDGCLYIDDDSVGVKEVEIYAIALGGVSWIIDEDDEDIDRVVSGWFSPRRALTSARSPKARVLASGLKTADDFRAAIAAHRASQSGGAK